MTVQSQLHHRDILVEPVWKKARHPVFFTKGEIILETARKKVPQPSFPFMARAVLVSKLQFSIIEYNNYIY